MWSEDSPRCEDLFPATSALKTSDSDSESLIWDLGLVPAEPRGRGIRVPAWVLCFVYDRGRVYYALIRLPILLMKEACSQDHQNAQCFCTDRVPVKGRDLTFESEAAPDRGSW